MDGDFQRLFVPSANMINNEHDDIVTFEKCIAFVNAIGIQTIFRSLGDDSFLPGFLIENGTIIIDRDTLKYPGDILHEAGHVAVVSTKDRARLTENAIIKRKDREAEEIMAIAWSYAACLHLDIDPDYVFHEEGYRGGSSDIMESCRMNDYIGILMLQSVGMMTKAGDKEDFPPMKKWLRA